MGLVGREIIQSRVWIDPSAPPPPNLNYKETFPNTVFEAVYESMDLKTAKTLKEVLDDLHKEVGMRQMRIPAKSSNYLMTFAGTAGAVGAIQLTREIPWDKDKQQHDRVPTEKAVGDLIQKLGLIDEYGNLINPNDRKIRWSDIIGRPIIYTDLGDNEDGFMTQKAINDNVKAINNEITRVYDETVGNVKMAINALSTHEGNKNNPHNVTVAQIGAVSDAAFASHVNDYANPHKVTATIIGLGNVDNTSDMDKPISTATQAALNKISVALDDLITDANAFLTDVTYDITTGDLTATHADGSTSVVNIPIFGLVDEISYDINTKEFVYTEQDGTEKRIDVSDLYIRYQGSVGSHITVTINDASSSGTMVPKDGMFEFDSTDITTMWDSGLTPSDAEDDTASTGISQITELETEDMWGRGILPSESGTEQIDRDFITDTELEDMWLSGIFPIETPDVLVPGDGKLPNITGWQIIKATINAKSITTNELADDCIATDNIQDLAVTTDKIADAAITIDKIAPDAIGTNVIADYSIINTKIANRAVDGRTLFSSSYNNRILAVLNSGDDPEWTQIIGDMIDYNAIETRHILKAAVTADKLADDSIITSKIEDLAVTMDKINDRAVTNIKIARGAVDGDNLAADIVIPGTPSLTSRPSASDDGANIPDTHWVNQKLDSNVFASKNYGSRSVDGNALFSSATRHRALVVLRANSDPEWGQITHEMLGDLAVDNDNIIDKAIAGIKIKDATIERRSLMRSIISEEYIDEGAVTSEKLFTYHTANRVLATLAANGHPQYTQVTRDMIANGAISSMQIEDQSVTPSKIESTPNAHRLLGVALSSSNPQWMQLTSGMIGNRVVLGKHFFTTPYDNMVLGVTVANTDPQWMKIIAPMIADGAIRREHIGNGEIWEEHLQENIIESKHIIDRSITSSKIAANAITGTELFTSPYPNRILGVSTMPYSDPDWIQVATDMIEDRAVTKDKLFTADHDYEVLLSTKANNPPEYSKITNDFIVDDTIMPNKLAKNFILYGTPELTVEPAEDANNQQIANTQWVRNTIAALIKDFHPEILFKTLETDVIADHAVTGPKLFTSPYGPRVLGITAPNEEAEYLLVEEAMIADAAVTTNKIQHSVHLLGSPVIDVRPSPYSSDSNGTGQLIPDCQWVLDRIKEGGGSSSGGSSGSTTSGPLPDLSIATEKLMDRSVTAKKLFTAPSKNTVLGLLSANADPEYTKINNDMLEDKIVDSRVLFTSGTDNTVLSVGTAGDDPTYTKINHDMLEDNIIDTDNIRDNSINRDKIANGCITKEKLAGTAFVDESFLLDNAVTAGKIASSAVETTKIKDEAVISDKLASDLTLKGHPTVEPDTEFETRSIRNTIISPNKPTGGCSGDIWFTFV